jgi:hypothetical protein
MTYGNAHSMVLALATIYGLEPIEAYQQNKNRPSAFMQECVAQVPTDNPAQKKLRELCPVSKRVRLYVKGWGMDTPSCYVILHKVTGVYKLGCDRLFSNEKNFVDGILITWPDQNPEMACGETPIFQRIVVSASTVGIEILETPELRRELLLSAAVLDICSLAKTYTVWTHPQGRSVFHIDPTTQDISLIKVKPYDSPTIQKMNCLLWGNASNDVLPDAPELSMHIVPQIKGATPAITDPLLTNLLRYALEGRLLPFLAISKTTTRGDIYTLSYDPETDEVFPCLLGSNRKCTGLPCFLRYDNEGSEVFVPNLATGQLIKDLLFAPDVPPARVTALRGLFRTMAYQEWEQFPRAFRLWNCPLSPEEREQLQIIKSGV